MFTYPKADHTVDIVVLKSDTMNQGASILLIRRGNAPYKNCWALPGGFLDMDETLEEAAFRELQEETGLIPERLEQIGTFSALGRDPRGRTISTVFLTLVDMKAKAIPGDDAIETAWFPISELPQLAFDHKEIIDSACEKAATRIRLTPVSTEEVFERR